VGVEAGDGGPAGVVGVEHLAEEDPEGDERREDPVQPPAGGGQRLGQDGLGQDVGERQAAVPEELPPQEVGVGAERWGAGGPQGRGSCRVGRTPSSPRKPRRPIHPSPQRLRRCKHHSAMRPKHATFIWERSAKQSRPTACGWMGYYDGMTVEQMDALRKTNKLGLKEAFFLDWLELFRRLGPEMAPQTE
jgi:hypothetical protein